MAINTGNHPAALWPGVHAWCMMQYNQWPREYTQIFNVESSKMAYEEDDISHGFGLASVKSEGASATYDSHSQVGTKRYTHVAYSNGYIVTREERDDNLYEGKAFRRSKMLVESFVRTKETVAANVLNRAFTSGYTGYDGIVLCSTAHTNLAGTFANKPTTDVDLNEASLEDAITSISQFTDLRGLKIRVMPRKLIVPAALWATADRILKSTKQSGTANNDINVLNGLLPEGAVVNHYLTDTNAWFVKTDVSNGLTMFERTPYEFSRDNDFDTENAKAKGYERYSVGWTDPLCVYGTSGST